MIPSGSGGWVILGVALTSTCAVNSIGMEFGVKNG